MVSQSDFNGLQRDLQRRAGAAQEQAAAVNQAYQRLAQDWTGPSRQQHEPDNQHVLSLLAGLEQSLSSAAVQAGLVAQDFAEALHELATICTGVKHWLQSEGNSLKSDVLSLLSAIDSAALKYLGMHERDLPAANNPQWYELYETAQRHGMTRVV
jgi:hypothetical protein